MCEHYFHTDTRFSGKLESSVCLKTIQGETVFKVSRYMTTSQKQLWNPDFMLRNTWQFNLFLCVQATRTTQHICSIVTAVFPELRLQGSLPQNMQQSHHCLQACNQPATKRQSTGEKRTTRSLLEASRGGKLHSFSSHNSCLS